MNFSDLLRGKDIEPQQVLAFRHRPLEPELNKVLPWLAAEKPEVFNVGARPPEGSQTSPEFKPKDASEYTAWVAAHAQKRTRKHEYLVNNFAAHASAAGWVAGDFQAVEHRFDGLH